MADLKAALAELAAWAAEEPMPDQPDKAHTGSADHRPEQRNTGDESCLEQHQIRQLFALAGKVTPCPLPQSMMPELPR